ncbi:hypothetical protein AQAU111925_13170 [Aquirufa aurantiipilula]
MINLVAVPGLITPLNEPVAPPVVEVKVIVPDPEVPVYISLPVRSATPFTKSKLLFNLFVPDKPVIAPPKLVLAVTLFAEASNVNTALP